MKYVTVQTATPHFLWQMQVQLHNFQRLGIDGDMICIVTHPKDFISSRFVDLMELTKARIIFIEDSRESKNYGPSIKPFALWKFFEQNSINEQWCFLDTDVILKRPLTIASSDTVLISDGATGSFLNSHYIETKSAELLQRMADIVGISIEVIKANDINAGGAQYVFNFDLHPDFCKKVYYDSLNLYKLCRDTEHIYSPKWPIQSWTAEMWAWLWNLWLYGYRTQCSPSLDFCWATCKVSKWESCDILHNSGNMREQTELFDKSAFTTRDPFQFDLSKVNKDFCSSIYVEEIKQTAKWLSI